MVSSSIQHSSDPNASDPNADARPKRSAAASASASADPTAFPQPEDYLPGLYSPMVVWDTTRRAIVQNMTDAERRTFAKRSADQLQALMPRIDQAFREYRLIRPRYAREFLRRSIEDYDTLVNMPVAPVRKETWVHMNDRLDAIGSTISEYQRLLGYWSNALLALLPESDARTAALAAQDDLETLFHHQESLYTALQLEECLRLLHKAPPTDEVNAWVEKLSSQLDDCIKGLRKALRDVSQCINNVDVDTYLEAHQVVLVRPDDHRLNTLTEFLLIRQCFETINRQASGILLATLHDFCEKDYPEGRLFDLAPPDDVDRAALDSAFTNAMPPPRPLQVATAR